MLHAPRRAGVQERHRATNALRSAERACKTRGVQFTPIRRAVLESLWEANQPIGAYDLIRRLEEKLGRTLSPPTVYRALEFLLEQKFIARIETKNAFLPCTCPDEAHPCVFFICEACGSFVHVDNPSADMLFDSEAASFGFKIARRVIEMYGECATCQATASAAT